MEETRARMRACRRHAVPRVRYPLRSLSDRSLTRPNREQYPVSLFAVARAGSDVTSRRATRDVT